MISDNFLSPNLFDLDICYYPIWETGMLFTIYFHFKRSVLNGCLLCEMIYCRPSFVDKLTMESLPK